MASFNVSFLNPNAKKKSAKTYGILTDQLSMMEDRLAEDGMLSPGDYDLLQRKGQEIYSHPSLTPAERSNVSVKLSEYKKQGNLVKIKKTDDIPRVNREIQDDMAKNRIHNADNPTNFLQVQAKVYAAKLDQLSTSIDRLEASGGDATEHYNELTNTTNDYQDTLQALDDVSNYQAGATPTSNYATYLTTNARGEIVDMKISRIGASTGYSETNGVYQGLPVYGKINRKDASGNKIFQLGNEVYSAPDVTIPGADGTMKSSVLISSDRQKTAGKGGFTIAQSGYKDVDLTQVKPQQGIPEGGWVQGDKGSLYQRKSDGTYSKYINYNKEDLGIEDYQLTRMPQSFMQGIASSVDTTDDKMASTTFGLPTSMDPVNDVAGYNQTPVPAAEMAGRPAVNTLSSTPTGQGVQKLFQDELKKGRPNTGGAPTAAAPKTSMGTADQATGKAKGFFASLFG
jgi:hypothetical protein